MTQYMRFEVTLKVPDHAQYQDVQRDLQTSIGFGNPQIEFLGGAIFVEEPDADKNA